MEPLKPRTESSDLEKQEVVERQEDPTQSASRSPQRGPMGGWPAASFILGMEFFERLSFLGIGLNLVTYLHDQMQLPLPRSANIVTNFMGTSYLTCLLGGFIADTCLGRYKTTAIGCCIQLLGMIMVTLTVVVKGLKPTPCDEALKRCQEASTRQVAVLYIALYMIACGTGGIKSSLSGLGADQFEEAQEEGRKQMQSFFNWFGASVSAGATLAITALVYVQDNEGRGLGYSASATCMLLSLLIFLGGSPWYRSKPPSGSAFTCIAHVLVAAWRNRHHPLPASSALLFHHPSSSKALLHTPQFSFLDRASLVLPSISKIGELQSPWRLCSLEKVEEVKMVIRLLPILATTIVFWTANGQALTFSIEQGATLDRRLGKSFEIPPATFPVVLQLAMLITIPIYDRALIPLARKWRGNEYGITSLQRIGAGLLFSTLAMVVAALIENKRLKVAHTTMLVGNNYKRLPMSIFYLTPQYALVGIGEAFAYVGQLDFFYRESPDGMRSLSTGLCLSTLSFGLFLSSMLVDGVNRWTKHGSSTGWLANSLDDGRLDYFYWFLAFLSFLSFLCYLLCSHWYKYKHTWFMDVDDRNIPLCDEKPTETM